MRFYILLYMSLITASQGLTQSIENKVLQQEIALISDTQQPLGIERIFRRGEKNTLATSMILDDIVARAPRAVFMLGDLVSVGYKEKKWPVIDTFLARSRSMGIQVAAILGNHELFTNAARGEAAFNRRFPGQANTGYYKIVDSIGFVMLNSNFGKLSAAQEEKQQAFYTAAMHDLEADPSVVLIVVACHHSPYSNSRIVRSNAAVQEKFVPLYLRTAKAKLFVSGHSHNFEHFSISGKDFLTIGGGGGPYQPVNTRNSRIATVSDTYNPRFHYVLVRRSGDELVTVSRQLKTDFSGFIQEYEFTTR